LITAGGVRWAGGESVFVDRDIRQLLYGIGLRCESARVKRAEPGEVAVTAAIELHFKADNFRAGIKARHEKRSE
jgi:hypothetical protein